MQYIPWFKIIVGIAVGIGLGQFLVYLQQLQGLAL